MATKTRTDLIVRVLDKLQVTQTGQNPSPEDMAQVDGNLDTVLATLAGDEVVYVPNVDQIDEAFFEPLAVCVADKLALDFGTAIDSTALSSAQAVLLRMQRLRPMYVEQQTSYV